jgi:queuine/archaeosine tRNA-ribosyltransferase
MFTPIANGRDTLQSIQNIGESYDVNVMFDSGGYEVQVGNLEFDDLYSYLIDFYDENRWGHRYVLPDNVPVSDDTPDIVDQKVDETISASKMCFRRLPNRLKSRAVAVIQGHSKEQITRCLNEYSSLDGLKHVGFGSFSTSGISQGVNMLTRNAFDNLEWATRRAHEVGLSVHGFGIGGPTSIPLLYEAGVDSFDTTSWMRSSGYGNVFFPFQSRYNASHRKNRGGNILIEDELPHLKAETNHECPFCESISRLRNNRWDRIIHNLIVMHEMTNRIETMDQEEVIEAMNPNSRYRKHLEELAERPKSVASD